MSWDHVLASVPKKFGVEDVLKHPGAASKGRPQIYPALNRWEASKRIRRISKGIYEKLGGGRSTPAKQTSARKRRSRKAAPSTKASKATAPTRSSVRRKKTGASGAAGN